MPRSLTLFSCLFLCLLPLVSPAAPAPTEIPFLFKDGVIWLKIRTPTSAVPLNFLLDSGAGISILNLSTSRRLGTRLGTPQSVRGVSGSTVAYRVGDFEATLDQLALPRTLLALDLDGVSASAHQRIDGLLGADFLRDRIVQIDFQTGKLRFLDAAAPMEAGAEVLPMVRRNDAMCVGVSLAGQSPEWMRVDTGCRTGLLWVLPEARARKLGPAISPIAGSDEIATSVQLGSLRLERVRAAIRGQTLFRGESGLLGNAILSRYTVTIDSVHGRLLLHNKSRAR